VQEEEIRHEEDNTGGTHHRVRRVGGPGGVVLGRFRELRGGHKTAAYRWWQGPPVGVGPENYVQAWGVAGRTAERHVRLGGNSEAYSTGDLSASSAGNLQVLSFTLQSDLANQLPGYNHLYVKMQGVGGAIWASVRQFGCCGSSVPEHAGPRNQHYRRRGAYIRIRYDPATGLTEWLHTAACIGRKPARRVWRSSRSMCRTSTGRMILVPRQRLGLSG